jgi:hypothetical protein
MRTTVEEAMATADAAKYRVGELLDRDRAESSAPNEESEAGESEGAQFVEAEPGTTSADSAPDSDANAAKLSEPGV